MTLSNRINSIKPSATLSISAKAAQLRASGKDIINMGVGEPDFDTPVDIKNAAIEALRAGATKYTPTDGTPVLKKAIQTKFRQDNGLDYALEQIIVSNGAKQVFFNLAVAVINPLDEVIIPAPYWVSYPDIITLMGGVPKIISTTMDQRFKITPESLNKTITSKTKLVILNSPSNPTGIAYTPEELAALGAVLEQHPHVLIATDDIYEKILWGIPKFTNIGMMCPSLLSRLIVINGVSKTYAMTGWRIGYAAGPVEIIAAMKKCQEQSTSCPSAISQAGATAALSGNDSMTRSMTAAYQQRQQLLINRLAVIPGIRYLEADGTFYNFIEVSEIIKKLNLSDDVAFCDYLLMQQGLAVVPGSAFGAPGHVRLSFAVSVELINAAMDRFEKACAR